MFSMPRRFTLLSKIDVNIPFDIIYITPNNKYIVVISKQKLQMLVYDTNNFQMINKIHLPMKHKIFIYNAAFLSENIMLLFILIEDRNSIVCRALYVDLLKGVIGVFKLVDINGAPLHLYIYYTTPNPLYRTCYYGLIVDVENDYGAQKTQVDFYKYVKIEDDNIVLNCVSSTRLDYNARLVYIMPSSEEKGVKSHIAMLREKEEDIVIYRVTCEGLMYPATTFKISNASFASTYYIALTSVSDKLFLVAKAGAFGYISSLLRDTLLFYNVVGGSYKKPSYFTYLIPNDYYFARIGYFRFTVNNDLLLYYKSDEQVKDFHVARLLL